MRKFLGAMMLTGVLMSPALVFAGQQRDHDRDDDRRSRDRAATRYYDPYQRDYHEWNDNEDRAYRHWVEQERHRTYKDYKKASKRDQRDYWRWRHEHSDWK